MSNFKSGSGNLDFGGNEEDDKDTETTDEDSQTQTEENEDIESKSSEESTSTPPDRESSDIGSTPNQPVSDTEPLRNSTESDGPTEEYPYFVRRSNVGDERDTRLEIHVRDKIADQEPSFRNELAERLEVNEVSKTDAREFALLAAFRYPDQVAELMQDEGFGTIGGK